MKAIVIHESLTGNTAKAGEMIAAELVRSGIPTVVSSITAIDMEALSAADLVIVGSWTDGLILFGQRPGRLARLVNMPVIDGKLAAVYCTYAIKSGSTLEQIAGVVSRRGGEVVGGVAIRRSHLEQGARELVDRLVGALEARQPAE